MVDEEKHDVGFLLVMAALMRVPISFFPSVSARSSIYRHAKTSSVMLVHDHGYGDYSLNDVVGTDTRQFASVNEQTLASVHGVRGCGIVLAPLLLYCTSTTRYVSEY
jgi:hypothetical protein